MKQTHTIFALLILTFLVSSCQSYEEKVQQSIDYIDSQTQLADLHLEEDDATMPIINDEVIEHIVISGRLDSVQNLTIIGCAISNTSALKLLEGTNLQKVKLSQCSGFDSLVLRGKKKSIDLLIEECRDINNVKLIDNEGGAYLSFSNTLHDKEVRIELNSSDKHTVLKFINEVISDSLEVVSDTSRYFLTVMRSKINPSFPNTFKNFKGARYIHLLKIDANKLSFKDLPYLEELNIDQPFTDEYDVKEIVLDGIPSLDAIKLRVEGLQKLSFGELKNLSLLHLTFPHEDKVTFEGLDALEGLHDFDYRGRTLSETDLKSMLSLPRLEKVSYFPSNLSEGQLKLLAFSDKIQSIHLNNIGSQRDFQRVLNMAAIREIIIGDIPLPEVVIVGHPTLESLSFSSTYDTLRRLVIKNCTQLESLAVESGSPEEIQLDNLPTLQSLHIGLCGLQRPEAFTKHLANLTTIDYLRLNGSCYPDWTFDLSALENLEYLYISPGHGVRNEVLLHAKVEGRNISEDEDINFKYMK